MTIVEAVMVVTIVGMVVGMPLLALSIRFALKPVVDAYVRLREAGAGRADVELLSARIAHLETLLEARGIPVDPLPATTRGVRLQGERS